MHLRPQPAGCIEPAPLEYASNCISLLADSVSSVMLAGRTKSSSPLHPLCPTSQLLTTIQQDNSFVLCQGQLCQLDRHSRIEHTLLGMVSQGLGGCAPHQWLDALVACRLVGAF